MALLQIPNRRDQCVNVFTSVVESERRADRTFDPEAPENGLRTMMARADRDALAIESRSHVLRTKPIQDERKYAGLFARRTDQAKPRDVLQSLRGVNQKIVFIARDVGHADAVEIIDGGAEPDGIRDVSRTRLKAAGRRLVGGLLEGDVLNH